MMMMMMNPPLMHEDLLAAIHNLFRRCFRDENTPGGAGQELPTKSGRTQGTRRVQRPQLEQRKLFWDHHFDGRWMRVFLCLLFFRFNTHTGGRGFGGRVKLRRSSIKPPSKEEEWSLE